MAGSSRFNQHRFPNRSQKRKFTWIGGNLTTQNNTTLAAATAVIALSFDTRGTLEPKAPWTIVRTRGYLYIKSDSLVGTEAFNGAFGIAVVNGEAFDAGVGSIPTPYTESFDDRWLYHEYIAGGTVVTTGGDVATSDPFTSQLDGKAMRKVNIGDVVVVVIENGSPTLGFNFLFNLRLGVKLV